TTGANPLLRRATIGGCGGYGVVVDDGGRGQIEDSEIYDTTGAAVYTASRGSPYLSGTSLRHAGIQVLDGGLAVLRGCDISGALLPGITVSGDGELTMTRSRVHDGAAAGVV